MDRELRDRWVARLRSGLDEQGEGSLKNVVGQKCCLGVLADLCGVPSSLRPGHNAYTYHFGEDEHGNSIDFSGLLPIDFHGLTRQQAEKLVDMNDSDQKNFQEIADWIEENL